MKIGRLQVTLEPWYKEGVTHLHINLWTNGKTHEVNNLIEDDDFSCMFDHYMERAKELLKEAVKEVNKEVEG